MAALTIAKNTVNGVPSWAWKTLIGIGLAGGGFFIARKIVRDIRAADAEKDIGTGTPEGIAGGYATILKIAMGSWGWDWASSFDGTDEEAIFQAAKELHSKGLTFGDVSKQYRKLYNGSLLNDLRKELSVSDFAKFNSLLETGLGYLKTPQKLIATQETTVLDEFLRPIATVKENQILGENMGDTITLRNGKGRYLSFKNNGKKYFIEHQKAMSVSL